jgi:hypothetical protein
MALILLPALIFGLCIRILFSLLSLIERYLSYNLDSTEDVDDNSILGDRFRELLD